MILTKLILENFRLYQKKKFNFDNKITLIIGQNAIGKTSILESIYLLSSTESFRAGKIDEMISYDQDFSNVAAKVGKDKLHIILTRGVLNGRKTFKRLYRVNDTKKSRKKYLGNFYAVIFRPEDMRLIEGSKSRRRKFMDYVLSVLDTKYDLALKNYERILMRRNKLLFQIKEGNTAVKLLTYWNQELIENGVFLQKKRQEFLDYFETINFPIDFKVKYQPSLINQDRVLEYQSRAIAAGHTLIGPHKDDLEVYLDEKNIAIYGSRGQQRLAVLWLKYCELFYLKEKTGEQPLLLLDDILSELDSENEELVLDLCKQGQTIVTTTEERVRELFGDRFGDLGVIDL